MKTYTCTDEYGTKLYVPHSSILAIAVQEDGTNRLHLTSGADVLVQEPVCDDWLSAMDKTNFTPLQLTDQQIEDD